ncbi:hypothetical protein LTR94_027949, partial [Friedmanniomyces endolithicus]
MTLRAVDIEAGKNGAGVVVLKVCTAVGLYILNHKRAYLQALLERRGLSVIVQIDDSLGQGEHNIDRTETNEDFVAPVIELPNLDDDFDASLYEDEDDDEDEEVISDEDDDTVEALEREDVDDDEPRERAERNDHGRGRNRRRRRGGRRDEETVESGADTLNAEEASDDEEDEIGRRRRRGRRGGRRVREDGERDVYAWVRGRTPSLDDPYVWFDPLNPGQVEPRTESAAPSQDAAGGAAAADIETPNGEEGGGRSRRRRRRGRGRGGEGAPHDVKVQNRATNEGMPLEGSPDTPMAVMIEAADQEALVLDEAAEPVVSETVAAEEASAAPVALAPEPQRRRVRR